jgi:hypothetical protein
MSGRVAWEIRKEDRRLGKWKSVQAEQARIQGEAAPVTRPQEVQAMAKGASGTLAYITEQTKQVNRAETNTRARIKEMNLTQHAEQIIGIEVELGNKLIEAWRTSDVINDWEAAGLWFIKNRTNPPWLTVQFAASTNGR